MTRLIEWTPTRKVLAPQGSKQRLEPVWLQLPLVVQSLPEQRDGLRSGERVAPLGRPTDVHGRRWHAPPARSLALDTLRCHSLVLAMMARPGAFTIYAVPSEVRCGRHR